MSMAINAEHLSKEYRLGVINHGMLYKDMQSWMARKLGRADPHEKIGTEHYTDGVDRFWALKDVSFDLKKGDRLGIIGRNGAGKSTVLKILSRITAPTEGKVALKGRVASLLEVGTGFHPELTGRENIFLNGAILGMKRREIARRLDEIVAFSEISKFIDTPVKRYSSGMYVRLAFAVAAHLDSEILLADEVLSVGDTEFQKKCLGKMESVSSEEGKTIIFVSHNMATIKKLCNVGFCLVDGRISHAGEIDAVIMKYLSVIDDEASSSSKIKTLGDLRRAKGLVSIFKEIWMEDDNGQICNSFPMGTKVRICVSFSAQSALVRPGFGCAISNAYGDRIVSFASYLLSGEPLRDRQAGTIVFQFSDFPLLPGDYTIDIGAIEAPYSVKDRLDSAYRFTIQQEDLFNTGQPLQSAHGTVYLNGSVSYRE